MTRTISLCALALVALVDVTSRSQAPPDFSGRWMVDAPAVTAPPGGGQAPVQAGDMGSGWGQTITIAQDGEQLAVEYAPYTRYDMQPPFKFVYALDGSESRNIVMIGRGAQVESSRAAWEGQSLTITTTFTVADSASGKPFTAEVTRKLSLTSPAALLVEVTRSGVLGGPSSTTRTIYKKG